METLKALLLLLALLALVGLAGMVAIGGGDGVYETEGIARIGTSPDETVQWLADPERRPRWVPGLEASALEGGLRHPETGARLRETVARDGRRTRRTVEVVELREAALVVLRSVDDGVAYEVRYAVRPNGTSRRTLVEWSLAAELPGLSGKLFEPVLGGGLSERVDGELDLLAEAVRAGG